MQGVQIEAIFENGVFRPLQPIQIPEHQRVTLVLPSPTDLGDVGFEEIAEYRPIPLEHRQTIRVRYRQIGDLPPVPYDVEPDAVEGE